MNENMKLSTQPYKGTRDFYPEDKAFQKWMFDKWRKVVESFGYVEYDAPILEPTDLYLIKGSQEIIETQTYTFKDRGDRSVTIRTEMTPSVSRMVAARRQELAYPLRWYSIPNLWRYERMQKGRLREFWQLNVDLFGDATGFAEFEMLQIIDAIFQSFDAKRSSYIIKINSRVLVNKMLLMLGVDEDVSVKIIRLVDKIQKMETSTFAEQLDKLTGLREISKAIIGFLSVEKVEDLPQKLLELESSKLISDLINKLNSLGIKNVVFDPTLMRGFDYYTDIVFEAFDTNTENNRAILGGGRYDGLVGQMGVEPVPTIGFAVGDVVFEDFLRIHKMVPKILKTNSITVLPRDNESFYRANSVARELRQMGVSTSVDTTSRKIDKKLKSAIKSGALNVVFVGNEELDNDSYTLKVFPSGKEEKHSLQRIVSIVLDSRKK